MVLNGRSEGRNGGFVGWRHGVDTWRFFNGLEQTGVRGMRALARLRLEGAIWTLFSGQEQMGVRGTKELVHVLLEVDIWKYFSGLVPTGVRGIVLRV